MDGTCQVLTIDEIVSINRKLISKFGGMFFEVDDNLRSPGSLEFVLDEIQGSLFGVERFPTVIQKCAVLGWRIIEGHIFHDGNKRTGIETCRAMLEENSYIMRIDEEVITKAIEVASASVTIEAFCTWVEERTIKVRLVDQ
jgi:death on curing protein